MKRALFITTFFFAGLIACTSQNTPVGKTATKTETTTTEEQVLPYHDIDVAEFRQKMAEPGNVLMDVRTPEEIANGKIEGAIELDYRGENFETEIAKLDKSKTYLVYCRSGNRSGKTCNLMAGMGFKNLYNLAGGYIAWSQE